LKNIISLKIECLTTMFIQMVKCMLQLTREQTIWKIKD